MLVELLVLVPSVAGVSADGCLHPSTPRGEVLKWNPRKGGGAPVPVAWVGISVRSINCWINEQILGKEEIDRTVGNSV